MSLPSPPSQQSSEQQIARLTPGWQALNSSAILVWLVLGLTGLVAGITWRLTGSGPGIFELFDALGFAYWLVPWLLVRAWEKMRARQTIHFTRGGGIFGLAIANAMKMLGYLLLISLAPLGLFTSFGSDNLAVLLRTDMPDIGIGYPEFVLIMLLLTGTIVLCFSLATLIGTRGLLGSGIGALVWAAIGIVLNSSALTGTNYGRFNLSFGGLAEYARLTLNGGLIDPAQVGYVTDSVRLLYGVLLVALIVGVGLLVLLQFFNDRPGKTTDIYLLPALVGMLMPAIYTYAHTSRWVADPALTYPLPWLNLFLVGLIPLLVVYTFAAWQQEYPHFTRVNMEGLLLLWLCPLAWFAYASPVVFGGQVGKLQLALASTISMLLILLWVVLSNYAVRARPMHPVGRGAILTTLLFAIVVPITGSHYPSLALLLMDLVTAFEGSQMLVAVGVSGLASIALGIAVCVAGRRSSARPDIK